MVLSELRRGSCSTCGGEHLSFVSPATFYQLVIFNCSTRRSQHHSPPLTANAALNLLQFCVIWTWWSWCPFFFPLADPPDKKSPVMPTVDINVQNQHQTQPSETPSHLHPSYPLNPIKLKADLNQPSGRIIAPGNDSIIPIMLLSMLTWRTKQENVPTVEPFLARETSLSFLSSSPPSSHPFLTN